MGEKDDGGKWIAETLLGILGLCLAFAAVAGYAKGCASNAKSVSNVLGF